VTAPPASSRRRTGVALAGVGAAWLALSLALNLPPHLWALFTRWHWGLALEAGAALALVALWRGSRGGTPRALVHAVAGVLVVLVALRLADLTARSVVDRPLNLFLDVSLLPALADVAQTLLGPGRAVALAAGLALGLVALQLAIAWLLRRTGRAFEAAPVRRGFYAAGAVALAVFAAQKLVPGTAGLWQPIGASASRAVAEQAERLAGTLVQRGDFRLAAARDPAAGLAEGQLLAGLDGADVIVVFIESYGVSALDDPRYAPVVGPRVDALGRAAAEAGWSVASGRLVSPTAGGQSWLAHATLTSGLWVDNQTLYSLFLAEDGTTLVDDFDRAGRTTVQVMPAITLPWPEGRRLGFDVTYEAADFGYDGPPFYWGIVPDQFALDVLADRHLDGGPADRPVFAFAALISSHAPWLPVPEVVAWDALGDGAVYRRWTEDAPEPREVWRDRDAVRAQYARSVAHSIDAVAAFLADRVDPSALVIVAGDHQPAPLITGPDASRAVPVHVFAGDPARVAAFRGLGFEPGVRPPPAPADGDAALLRMDAVRGFLLEAFSRPAATAAGPRVPAADR
jgi:hypothetical protein